MLYYMTIDSLSGLNVKKDSEGERETGIKDAKIVFAK